MGSITQYRRLAELQGWASGDSLHNVSDDGGHMVLCTGTCSVRSPEGSSAPDRVWQQEALAVLWR